METIEEMNDRIFELAKSVQSVYDSAYSAGFKAGLTKGKADGIRTALDMLQKHREEPITEDR